MQDPKNLIEQSRLPGRAWDVFKGDDILNIYVDGSSGVAVGIQTVKVDFFRVVSISSEGDLQVEGRDVVVSLVLPTNVFVEFVVNAFRNLKENEEVLGGAMQFHERNFHKMLGEFNKK